MSNGSSGYFLLLMGCGLHTNVIWKIGGHLGIVKDKISTYDSTGI